jgi:hypothetical protein
MPGFNVLLAIEDVEHRDLSRALTTGVKIWLKVFQSC